MPDFMVVIIVLAGQAILAVGIYFIGRYFYHRNGWISSLTIIGALAVMAVGVGVGVICSLSPILGGWMDPFSVLPMAAFFYRLIAA